MSDDIRSSLDDATRLAHASPGDSPPTISSEELLQGRNELWIEHEGQVYRLRVTSRGKLYLTK